MLGLPAKREIFVIKNQRQQIRGKIFRLNSSNICELNKLNTYFDPIKPFVK